jgi:hypothetical protein
VRHLPPWARARLAESWTLHREVLLLDTNGMSDVASGLTDAPIIALIQARR